MTKELEERLATLERELATTKQSGHGDQPESAKKPAGRNWKKILLTTLLAICLIAAAWLGQTYLAKRSMQNTIPGAIQSQVDFPVYVPRDATYRIDKKSITYSNDILTYTSQKAQDSYTITQQKMPEGFDVGKFLKGEGISQAKTLTLPTGRAIAGQVLGKDIAILATHSKTLVTITAVSPGQATTLDSALRSLYELPQ